jgi:hypothetical protein
MTTPVRFAYADTEASRAEGSLLAYVPITLRHGTHVVTVPGLLDTGSTVNVLPYPLGLQLGFVWEQQPTRVHLTGSLVRLPARGRPREAARCHPAGASEASECRDLLCDTRNQIGQVDPDRRCAPAG